jgi:hypothetical protein
MTQNPMTNKMIFVLTALNLLHFAVLIVGLKTNQFTFLATILNALIGFSILIYWMQKQFWISQHVFEWRETLVLAAEILVLAAAFYALNFKNLQWIKILQHLAFGIHWLCCILLLVFLLTFKMKKLF